MIEGKAALRQQGQDAAQEAVSFALPALDLAAAAAPPPVDPAAPPEMAASADPVENQPVEKHPVESPPGVAAAEPILPES